MRPARKPVPATWECRCRRTCMGLPGCAPGRCPNREAYSAAVRPPPLWGRRQKAQCQAGIGNHGLGGVGEKRQIRGAVPDVIECALAEAAAQAVEFFVSGEVGGAVRSQYTAEDTQIGRASCRERV